MNENMAFDLGPTSSKKILYAGKRCIPEFTKGSKVTFHFQCQLLTEERDGGKLIDDSRKYGRPMELIIGKQFKMPAWEECLKSMREEEVAQFDLDKSLVTAYPFVSKSFRQFAGVSKKENRPHCCGLVALKEGTGQNELDHLVFEPQDLRFIIELLKVELPGEYNEESWSMTPEDKLKSVPTLKEIGNLLFKNEQYAEACEKYSEALSRLEQLILREKPGEEEWLELERMKVPLLLNYAQCKLLAKDYYPVIEYASTVLATDPNNVKALYRRAKAYTGVWDLECAQKDFQQILQLDSSMKNLVTKELCDLKKLQKLKDEEDKQKLLGKMF